MVPIPKGSAEIHRQHSGIVRRRADSGKSGCSAGHDSPLHMRRSGAARWTGGGRAVDGAAGRLGCGGRSLPTPGPVLVKSV